MRLLRLGPHHFARAVIGCPVGHQNLVLVLRQAVCQYAVQAGPDVFFLVVHRDDDGNREQFVTSLELNGKVQSTAQRFAHRKLLAQPLAHSTALVLPKSQGPPA